MRSLHAAVLASLLLACALVGAGGSASADSISHRLAKATLDQQTAQQALRKAERRADRAIAAYGDVTGALHEAAVDLITSYRRQLEVSAQLAAAQAQLNRQAATAFEAGPGLSIELALGARSAGDLASIEIYSAHAIAVSADAVRRVSDLKASVASATAELERRRQDLVRTSTVLRQDAIDAMADLASARDDAAKAGATVKSLRTQQDALAKAVSVANTTMADLVDAQRGLDQRDLLALLGPTGGRGCDLPPGLRDTGERMSGISSWYGWELAGHPTATGAIFDPRLFTAANKELPLNSFIRVHFNGRCAIVLVNDRGPYKPGRVFDLSQAAADYLGVGLNFVTADILIPVR